MNFLVVDQNIMLEKGKTCVLDPKFFGLAS